MATTLELAQAGDANAFAALVAPHRRELRVHCYRMLGSLMEAEDILQEVLQAAWAGLPGFEQRASLRTWLYRIATNRCLNARRDEARRRRRVVEVPFDLPPPSRHGDQPHLQPFPDLLLPTEHGRPAEAVSARADIELAFVAALQRLPGRQVAALVLHDVVGFDRTEIADLLATTPASVKGLLQRARTTVANHHDATAPPLPGTAAERAVVDRFATALVDGDVDGLVALLTSDTVLAMPPMPHEYVGPAAVADFLAASRRWLPDRQVELRPLRANTQPGFVHLLIDRGTGAPASTGVVLLTLSGDRISRITRFLDPSLAAHLAAPTAAAAEQSR